MPSKLFPERQFCLSVFIWLAQMSYCRWSSDGFRCDVYAYESASGDFVIHVASGRKEIPADMWPPHIYVIKDMGEEVFREMTNQWQEAYDALPMIPINSPSAGKTFHEPDLLSFKRQMLMLIEEGLYVPEDVIDIINEEIRADNNTRIG